MTPFTDLSFFYPVFQICEIGYKTFSTSHKNEDPSPLGLQKSKRMKYDSQIKRVSPHSVMIRHETHVSLNLISVTNVRHQPSIEFSTILPKTRKLLSQCPLLLGPNLITTGINATYDLISSITLPLFNINGSRSNITMNIFKCAPK